MAFVGVSNSIISFEHFLILSVHYYGYLKILNDCVHYFKCNKIKF
jgi:hypothetical protein